MTIRAPFLILQMITPLLLVPVAAGQIDTKLVPRAFEGKPLTARVETLAPGGSAVIFRVYTFNAEGELQKIEQGTSEMGTTLLMEYTNDEQGRPLIGQSSFMGNPTNRIEFDYDDQGRCIEQRQLMSRNDRIMRVTTFAYDEKGNTIREITKIPGRDAEVLERRFDEDSRPIRETLTIGERTNRTVQMDYDEKGCLVKSVTQMTNGNKSSSIWIRGTDCRATQLQSTTFTGAKTGKTITYDQQGNPFVELITKPGNPESEPDRLTWSYEYSSSDQAEKDSESGRD